MVTEIPQADNKPNPQPSPDPWGRVLAGVMSFLAVMISTAISAYIGTDDLPEPLPQPTEWAHTYVKQNGKVVEVPLVLALAGASPGQYVITRVPKAGDEELTTVVISGGPAPGPAPGPKPQPTELWCVIVEETGNESGGRTPQHAAVVLSKKFREMFGKDRFRLVDKDHGDEETGTYIQRAVGSKLPRMFIVTQATDVLYEGDLPATEDDAVALVNRLKEGK